VTSNFLSDIVSSSSTPAKSIPTFLQSLGKKVHFAGLQIEEMYSTGSFALVEFSNELRDIQQNLPRPSQDLPLLTQKSARYFLARFNQMYNLAERFHSKVMSIERTIQDIQKLYHVYGNFSYVVKHFNENELKYKKMYDMKIVRQELDFERGQMDQLMNVSNEVMRVGQSIYLYSKKLAYYMKEIMDLIDKKIVTQEDYQALDEVVKTVIMAQRTWDKMDIPQLGGRTLYISG
jgi:hypothetical protein